MRSTTTLRTAAAMLALALPLAACSTDEEPAEPDTDAIQDAAEDLEDDVDETVEDAEEVLEGASGYSTGRGMVEVDLLETTMVFEGEDDMGCFLSEDGGSMGGLSFDGVSADGAEMTMDWAGDSPDSTIIDIEPGPDGSIWVFQNAETDISVDIDGTTAQVTATMLEAGADGREAEMTATVTCGG